MPGELKEVAHLYLRGNESSKRFFANGQKWPTIKRRDFTLKHTESCPQQKAYTLYKSVEGMYDRNVDTWAISEIFNCVNSYQEEWESNLDLKGTIFEEKGGGAEWAYQSPRKT
jgi:hypothetical protein